MIVANQSMPGTESTLNNPQVVDLQYDFG